MGVAATVGVGGVQYYPFRARTAHAAGGVIRDYLDADRHCRYTVCSSHLAATTAAVVVGLVRALTRTHISPLPGPTGMPPAAASPPPAYSSRAHTPRSSPPATVRMPSAAATWSPTPLLSSSPPFAHSPSAHISTPPGPTGMPPATASPPPVHSTSAHTPPAACSSMPEWYSYSIADDASTTSSSPSPAATPTPRTYRRRQPPPVAPGYSSLLTPPATRMVGETGDECVPRRTRSEGRQLSGVAEEAVSTPLPEATPLDYGVKLLCHAGGDVLLSLLANRRALNA